MYDLSLVLFVKKRICSVSKCNIQNNQWWNVCCPTIILKTLYFICDSFTGRASMNMPEASSRNGVTGEQCILYADHVAIV